MLVGSVLSAADLVRLVRRAGCAPAAEASENVTLTARSGRTDGIIAVETQGTQGYVCVEGAFRERISGRTAEGRVPLAPYEVLVLEKIR